MFDYNILEPKPNVIYLLLTTQVEPDYNLIKKMPYLEMCIEESLRLSPFAKR